MDWMLRFVEVIVVEVSLVMSLVELPVIEVFVVEVWLEVKPGLQ